MVKQFGLEEPLVTSCTAEDKLFPVVFDCAVYPWERRAGVMGREIGVLDKTKEKKAGSWWSLGALSLVVGVVVGGLILWRRRNWVVCLIFECSHCFCFPDGDCCYFTDSDCCSFPDSDCCSFPDRFCCHFPDSDCRVE